MFDDAPTSANLLIRYLDDAIGILPKVETNPFLEHLIFQISIQFTIEKEQHNKSPILFLIIYRSFAGIFPFLIYKKPTHTWNYLKFLSNRPKAHERAVVLYQSLIDKANNLGCWDKLPQGMQVVTSHLKQNGYPSSFIRNSNQRHVNN